ncbi:hypothetical protein [Paenibacillus allorhizoplanae]|uniref:hypothetical protein n=1 Tax=Paenibacillus allorhizoplanae TaxID=2905648 RepID=UPI0030B8B5EE
MEVFAETGYYHTTTAQVAQRGGISQYQRGVDARALEASWARIAESFCQVIATASPDGLERG